ncbi:MAG: cobyric acid synthase [Candidatus Pacebacteria bacterium]|nr:cobyric acid synthase [Candidatus Paceibacterota bacterium]
MIQGTGSDVGKSLMVAGLCRLFNRRGMAVMPFKPQNMSNNAAAVQGGEIGRAQALQARAARVTATVDMNPILLKPQAGGVSQLVVQGRVSSLAPQGVRGQDYGFLKPRLLPAVMESWQRICSAAELVLVEGAGSPAEVNLRAGDLANMGFAEAADLPVVMVGDIDRGGVIASLVGTYQLLPLAERLRIKAYIINRFRGDVRLFDNAIPIIGHHTGWPSVGIVPWFDPAQNLPAEDSLSLLTPRNSHVKDGGRIRIIVPVLPHGANLDDLDPLRAEPRVELILVPSGQPLPSQAELVILTGSKSTLADLASLRAEGWDIDIQSLIRHGTRVLGLCGGYQMLGQGLSDSGGLEGGGAAPGLGLLAVDTILSATKTVRPVKGIAGGVFGQSSVSGYEIHLGQTSGADCARALLPGLSRDYPPSAGAVCDSGLVFGTYLHGIFGDDEFRKEFLRQISPEFTSSLKYELSVEQTLDGLADHLETHLDIAAILRIAGG